MASSLAPLPIPAIKKSMAAEGDGQLMKGMESEVVNSSSVWRQC
jgi:hypothetical protein